MEFPDLGKHCSEQSCKMLDFLPVKCDACNQIFCNDHFNYTKHNCNAAYTKNYQVPVCPLCNNPVPTVRGQPPDIAVEAHIERDCASDPAKNRRKAFANRCSAKGCKIKEAIPITCSECRKNFCLKHRHTADHACLGKQALRNVQTSLKRNTNASRPQVSSLQGTMSEDEALARAIALSMQESNKTKKMTQEELDFELARQLQRESEGTRATTATRQRARPDKCDIS